ncbi:hypothetical protein A2U01_0111196, partial [Trifolium medium]|nr:hypothetical protein [Trifolium medium]
MAGIRFDAVKRLEKEVKTYGACKVVKYSTECLFE